MKRWEATVHFGPRLEDEAQVRVTADTYEAARDMLDQPSDDLRPLIEAAMVSKGRDTRMAWEDYEVLEVEEIEPARRVAIIVVIDLPEGSDETEEGLLSAVEDALNFCSIKAVVSVAK